MTTFDFTKNDTPNFIFCSTKGTPKMAHPVPECIVVTPPPGGEGGTKLPQRISSETRG